LHYSTLKDRHHSFDANGNVVGKIANEDSSSIFNRLRFVVGNKSFPVMFEIQELQLTK